MTKSSTMHSSLGPQTDDERRCFDRGMEQWRASMKRPDMTEEDRVKGALEAYCRQAFALALSPPIKAGEAVPVGWMTADGRIATDETKRTAMASPSRVAFNIPLYASPPPEAYGVRVVSEEMVEAAARAWCRAWDIVPDFPYSMVAGAAPWWKVEAKSMRAALEAALSHTEQEETTP